MQLGGKQEGKVQVGGNVGAIVIYTLERGCWRCRVLDSWFTLHSSRHIQPALLTPPQAPFAIVHPETPLPPPSLTIAALFQN